MLNFDDSVNNVLKSTESISINDISTSNRVTVFVVRNKTNNSINSSAWWWQNNDSEQIGYTDDNKFYFGKYLNA